MFPILFFAMGVLALLSPTHALTCGQTECNRDGYQKAYCCGDLGQVCCRETVASIWWFWLTMVVAALGIGIGIFFCCRCYRRRLAIPYVVQTNASTVVTTQQSNVTQIPTAIGHPPYSGYPSQQGYVSKDPTIPGYGYPPAPN